MPLLFGDADLNGTGVGMIVLGVANLFFGFLAVWVKARTDAKIAVLERDLKGCTDQHAAAKADAAAEAATVAARFEQLERSLAAAEAENDRQRELKHVALNRAQALGNRVAFIESLWRHHHPGDVIPVYPDDTGEHRPIPDAPKG